MNEDRSTHQKDGDGIQRITRRSFIHLMQCMGVGTLIGGTQAFGQMQLKSGSRRSRLIPHMPGRLVHVYDSDATFWDFSTFWYGYHVDQTVVDNMVEAGLEQLTNTTSPADIWRVLTPKYTPGQKFAIKVNFNNFSATGPDPDPDINGVIEPVNGLIRTMVLAGVPQSDISVYEVTDGWHSGALPQISFINRCLYPGVNFVMHYGNPNPFSATEKIEFDPPGPPTIADARIANVVVDADYLINMFIPKAHSLAGVTLGFKNHLGSFERCEKIHTYLPYNYYYSPNYSTYVDYFKNPHFGPKTVLTICDGLFGNWVGVSGAPKRWLTFGNDAPNSLFFSADPVAIDSVLTDFIEKERIQQGYGLLMSETRDCFGLLEAEGWGIHESADPWRLPMGSDYKRIQYIYVDGV